MTMIRRAGRASVVAALLLCWSAATARAEGVLDMVPSDAWVVVRINRLEQTNKKAAAWAEAMGIAQLSPEAADPLGAFEQKMNIKGLDRTRDMAIALLDPASTGGDSDKSVLILVPTSDYKAMVASLPGAKTEGAISTFTPEGEGEPGYVANWGTYAAISPVQAIVSKKPGGLKLSGFAAKEMQEKDAVFYANIPAMRAKLLPELQKARAKLKKDMQQQFGGGQAGVSGVGPGAGKAAAPGAAPAARPATPRPANRPPPAQRPGQRPNQPQSRAGDASADVELTAFQSQPARQQPGQPARRAAPAPARRPAPAPSPADAETDDDDADATPPGDADPAMAMMKQYGPAMEAMVDQYFAVAERFLTDTTAATFSVNLTDAGLNTTMAAEFTPGSYLGKIASGMKNTDASLLAGLPGERKYFAFGGMNISPEPWNQLLTEYVDPVVKKLGNAGPGGQNVTQLVEAMKKTILNTRTTTMGYPAPTGALGTESIIQQISISTGNAKEIAAAQSAMLKGMNSLLQSMPKAAAGGQQAPEVSFQVQEGGKTVGGVKLDSFKMDMQMDPDSPQAAQAQQMMAMIYGPNGISGVLGAVNDKTFVAVQGGSDQLVEAVVKAAQNPKDMLSGLAPVKAAGGQLPQNRFGVFYLQLDQLITSGTRYAQGFGVPVKMQLPPNLPPIGFSAASEGSALRFDTHVPTTTVQSIVAAGMQAYMQMQGGGAPGAPEGL